MCRGFAVAGRAPAPGRPARTGGRGSRRRASGAGADGAGEALAELEQRYERLGVGGVGEDRVELGDRPDLDVDALVLLDRGALVDVGDAGGEVEVHDLVGEADRAVVGAERLPVLGL